MLCRANPAGDGAAQFGDGIRNDRLRFAETAEPDQRHPCIAVGCLHVGDVGQLEASNTCGYQRNALTGCDKTHDGGVLGRLDRRVVTHIATAHECPDLGVQRRRTLARESDEGVVPETTETHRSLCGDCVTDGHGNQQSIMAEHIGLHGRTHGDRAGDANVDRSVGQRPSLLVGRHRVEFDTYIGPCRPEAMQERRDELIGGRVDETEPESTPSADTKLLGSPQHALRRHEELTGMGEKRLTVGGQSHSTSCPLEQGETEVGLELADLLAQRRLSDVELRGSSPEMELVGNGDKGTEAAQRCQLIHSIILSVVVDLLLHHYRSMRQTAEMGKHKPPARYSAFGLLWRGLRKQSWPRIWREPEFKSSYDVVIIGGGVHGLATAYYLAANHGITDIAVVDRAYLGSGGSGRNTAIVRSNYLTPEGVAFYDRSLELYNSMSNDLNLNVMFSERGHLTLAHTDSALRTMHWRAEVNKLQGIDSSVIDPTEIKKLTPSLDVSTHTRYPIMGALYHPPGGTIRHDAVVWGYARGADAYGVDLFQQTEVLDILTEGDHGSGKVTGVRTSRGDISTPVVVNCTAGWASTISSMVDVRLPITTHPLQAAVTEPVKTFLPTVVVSGSLHVYVSQTDRGELVFGASVDPVATYNMGGTLEFTEELAGHVLELMPGISKMRLLRQWAGLCDMTPDYSPVMGPTPVDGFYVDVGWGTYGFKAGPVSGEQMAACVANGATPDLIKPFELSRFTEGNLVGEKGAAAVGH